MDYMTHILYSRIIVTNIINIQYLLYLLKFGKYEICAVTFMNAIIIGFMIGVSTFTLILSSSFVICIGRLITILGLISTIIEAIVVNVITCTSIIYWVSYTVIKNRKIKGSFHHTIKTMVDLDYSASIPKIFLIVPLILHIMINVIVSICNRMAKRIANKWTLEIMKQMESN